MPAASIHNMTIIRYTRDGRHWDEQRIEYPSWQQVEEAVSQMDNFCFPIVQLNPTEDDENEDIFNVCGGLGRWALFQMMGDWQYEDPAGTDRDVRLWESDQGYFCKEKNILTDIDKVLRITRAFYDTGSYDKLDAVK